MRSLHFYSTTRGNWVNFHTKSFSAVAAASLLLVLSGVGRAETLIDDTVTATWAYPNLNTIYQNPLTQTGDGVNPIVFPSTSFTGFGGNPDNSAMTITVTATQVIFDGQFNSGCAGYPNNPTLPCFPFDNNATFNGFTIADDTLGSSIATATYDSATGNSWTAFGDPGRITIDNGVLEVNFQGLSSGPGNELIVDYTLATATPEPSTWLLAGCAIAFGAVKRIRRAKA